MRISITMRMCVALAALAMGARAAENTAARSFAAPEGAVWVMFDRFEHRDVEGYVACMADDYRFDSDEPGFTPMNREDERAFATHIFQGMPARDGRPALPALAYAIETVGPMHVCLAALADGRVSGTIENHRIQLVFADSTRMEVGAARSDFELVLTESGWRVRRWHESTATGAPDPAVAVNPHRGLPAFATGLPNR